MNAHVIGDSWASAREADTGLDAGWPAMMGIQPELRQGISGSTAAEWHGDKDGRLTRAIQTQADVVIVSLLGNDARAAMADGQVTAEEIAAALLHMRTAVSAVQRKLTIVLLYADPFCGQNPQARIAVPILNGAIRAACFGMSVVFADTGSWLTSEHFDGRDIHPTQAGHAVIAERMAELIKQHGRLI